MTVSRERILREADFHPRAVTYRVWGAVIPMVATIVLIPLIPFIVPFVIWYQRRHYARLRVILTTRDLKIYRGVWVREEKTIPLEKITDLRVFQGPLMRYFNVTGLAVETAGQTTGAAALASVFGIIDTEDFRDRVLAQRDRIADAEDDSGADGARRAPATASDGELVALLTEIRDTLQRIERGRG